MPDWPEILEHEGRAVWQTVYRILGNRADADECFQEAFLAAWEVSRREPVQNWRALLLRLAAARAVDRLRQRRRRAAREQPANLETVAGHEISPAQSALKAELSERLRNALARLAPMQAVGGQRLSNRCRARRYPVQGRATRWLRSARTNQDHRMDEKTFLNPEPAVADPLRIFAEKTGGTFPCCLDDPEAILEDGAAIGTEDRQSRFGDVPDDSSPHSVHDGDASPQGEIRLRARWGEAR